MNNEIYCLHADDFMQFLGACITCLIIYRASCCSRECAGEGPWGQAVHLCYLVPYPEAVLQQWQPHRLSRPLHNKQQGFQRGNSFGPIVLHQVHNQLPWQRSGLCRQCGCWELYWDRAIQHSFGYHCWWRTRYVCRGLHIRLVTFCKHSYTYIYIYLKPVCYMSRCRPWLRRATGCTCVCSSIDISPPNYNLLIRCTYIIHMM